MKMGYRISLLVVGILLAISTTIGSSYALWTITYTQEGTNKVSTGCFNLTNTYPITDENGLKLTPYTVILKNNCSIAATYDLTLTTDLQNTLSESVLKTNLKDITHNIDYSIKLMSNLPKTTLDENMAAEITVNRDITIGNTYSLAKGTLNSNEEVKYELRIWLDESATNETMSKKFTGVVSNTAYATESTN